MSELKPCPFCGGDAGFTVLPTDKIVFVGCWDCGARGPAVQYQIGLTEKLLEQAAEAWNGRYNK